MTTANKQYIISAKTQVIIMKKYENQDKDIIKEFIEETGITQQEFEMLMAILEKYYIQRKNTKKEDC